MALSCCHEDNPRQVWGIHCPSWDTVTSPAIAAGAFSGFIWWDVIPTMIQWFNGYPSYYFTIIVTNYLILGFPNISQLEIFPLVTTNVISIHRICPTKTIVNMGRCEATFWCLTLLSPRISTCFLAVSHIITNKEAVCWSVAIQQTGLDPIESHITPYNLTYSHIIWEVHLPMDKDWKSQFQKYPLFQIMDHHGQWNINSTLTEKFESQSGLKALSGRKQPRFHCTSEPKLHWTLDAQRRWNSCVRIMIMCVLYIHHYLPTLYIYISCY